MTRREKKVLLIASICFLLLVAQINKAVKPLAMADAQIQSKKIITPFELQQQLSDAGYYTGDVDGIIGRETIKAWEKACNEQMMKDLQDVEKRTASK